ncbi:MAG: hypothetical protein K5989_12500 [Lachnospiraceae bacterium]|nr:hypothetical protein [Lachnospiraceae bacterium]
MFIQPIFTVPPVNYTSPAQQIAPVHSSNNTGSDSPFRQTLTQVLDDKKAADISPKKPFSGRRDTFERRSEAEERFYLMNLYNT